MNSLTVRIDDFLIVAHMSDVEWEVQITCLRPKTYTTAIKMTNGQLAAMLSLGVFMVGEDGVAGFDLPRLEMLARSAGPAAGDMIPRSYQ